MSKDAQLQWERRFAPFAAAAAFGSVALAIAAQALAVAASADRGKGDRGKLEAAQAHQTEIVLEAVAATVATLLTAFALWYLYRAARSRRSQTPAYAASLLIAAPVLLALGSALLQSDLLGIADDFVAGERTEKRADELLEGQSAVGVSVIIGSWLALGFAVIAVSLNAMRAGLLSRFMGILGIVVGVLAVIPLFGGGPPVVRLFWLGALGLLFLGRWPGGRGPAWESGEPIPWPQPERRMAPAAPQPEQSEPSEEPEDRPQKRKRKKKRR